MRISPDQIAHGVIREDLSKTQLTESAFSGCGEMGAQMRALDWSETKLGAA